MICALMLGRENSSGFPGKNTYPLLGRPVMYYPLTAAINSKHIDKVYVSTDSPTIKGITREYGCEVIDRPPELCTDEALGEDAYVHGHNYIKELLKESQSELELLVLLMCNAVTVSSELIDEGIRILLSRPELDSAVTVSRYNMWSPLRARKIDDAGLLQPFVPFETFGDPATLNCDRDSQGDVYFADMGTSIVRPHCIENIETGLLPQKWMGNNIYPLIQTGGLDIDYEWQLPAAEHWLRTNGHTEPFKTTG